MSKFNYGDYVRVKAGFYEDTKGYVIEEVNDSGLIKYKVELTKRIHNECRHVTEIFIAPLLEKYE